SRGRAAWPMSPDGLQARPPKCLAICSRRSSRLRSNGTAKRGGASNCTLSLPWIRGPAYTGPRSGRDLRRHVLALGGVALFLGHGREALALAGVLALAGICSALAGALALAGIGADALAFAGGIGCGRHGGACQ